MKNRLLLLLLFLPFISSQAQTTKEEVMSNILQAGSTYFSYPGPPKGYKLTPAPKGYKPFYISHYGRHGSRYMTTNKYYDYAIGKMDSASKSNALTTLGKDVLRRLRIAYADAYLRDGDLSKLGGRQHQGIARRMYQNFPEVLSQPIAVDAKSSTVTRCAISMANFCQQLRGLNPKLQISMETSKRNMWYIANEDDSIPEVATDKAAKEKIEAFNNKMYKSDRLINSLFSDKEFVTNHINDIKLIKALYNIAEDMQCQPELKLSFFDIFTNEELFNIWQADNAGWSYYIGIYPSCTPRYRCHFNLLRNFLDTADGVIRSGKSTVTLRFGHDSILSPLAFLLHLKGCDDVTEDLDNFYKHWANFKIIPMAGNVQFVFYRKAGSNDILVKILLNEKEASIPVKTDCAPYYHWKDVDAFYRAELAK